MNQVVEKQTFFESIDLEEISKETGIPIWEIESVMGTLPRAYKYKTIKIARVIYEESNLHSKERFEAKLELDWLCIQELKKTLIFEQVLDVVDSTNYGSYIHKMALGKALETASNESDLKSLIFKIVDKTDPIRLQAIRKLIELRTVC